MTIVRTTVAVDVVFRPLCSIVCQAIGDHRTHPTHDLCPWINVTQNRFIKKRTRFIAFFDSLTSKDDYEYARRHNVEIKIIDPGAAAKLAALAMNRLKNKLQYNASRNILTATKEQ